MRIYAACQETRDALACPPKDALAAARVAAHRARCSGCRTYWAHIGQIGSAVAATAARGLDDIARARMAARLALSLDELATQNARRHAALFRPAVYRMAGALLIMIAAVLFTARWHRAREVSRRVEPAARSLASAATARPPAVDPAAIARPPLADPAAIARLRAPAATARPPLAALAASARSPLAAPAALARPSIAELPLIRPYGVAGMPAAALLGRSTDHLELPAGAVIQATLGPHARITVIGPAHLRVVDAGATTAVRLDTGVLIGEYEHHAGGTLRIDSPAATTTVVGTLFAVEATPSGRSRVAVRRGVVVVNSDGKRFQLRAGWSWSSGETAQPTIPARLVQQLAAHAAARSRSAAPVPIIPAARPRRLADLAVAPEPTAVPTPVLAVPTSPSTNGHPALQAVTMPTPVLAVPTSPSANGHPALQAATVPTPVLAVPTAPPSRPADLPPPVTAESLYAQAEAAMRSGDHAAVRRHLAEVIHRFPTDGLAAAALLELARLAQKEGQEAQARSYLDTLLARPREPALWEPARYLRCRLDVDAQRSAPATACLVAFRRDFPTSPHDAEVLALLIGLAQSQRDCPRATPLLDEYIKRYPHGPLDSRVRRARCAH